MKFSRSLGAVATFAAYAHACGDDHNHSHAKRAQPESTPSSSWPRGPLPWGDVNFLHTTDSHGWLIGHLKSSQPEPNYSADFGDFASFVKHMKKEADLRGVDLLLVDSGDLHDGNGLSDGYPAGGVDGQRTNEFITRLPYDVLAIGNHELYEYPIAYDMHTNFAPKWKGKYLSSNVNITYTDSKGTLVNLPIGERFRKFHTKQGRKVTAFGVLYNFTGGAKNTTVQPVADMVKEEWFHKAIEDEPDFFLLVGHMPVQKDNWPVVFNAIRAVHPTTPIYIFGGHTHIRDCVQYDGRSMALESGRYLETIGWMSSNIDFKGSNRTLNINRRYLDPNRNTYQFHTKREKFDTPKGRQLSKDIASLAKEFNITYQFGTAPQDYYLSRTPFPSNQSVLTLLTDQVLPTTLVTANPERASIPKIIIVNSGSQRFDLYKGPFTRNDQFIVSPFNDEFLYVSAPFSIARQVLGLLNKSGTFRKRYGDIDSEEDAEAYGAGYVDHRYNRWLKRQWEERDQQLQARADAPTLGYVTTDSCPGVGDDTLHTPIPHYSAPNYISSPVPTGLADDAAIDLVFLDFFQSTVLQILNNLSAGSKTYTASDVGKYGGLLTNEIFGIFAAEKWN
jgi:2',3'-cyclic-nucleotide 2'-phosphodiesterase (5'-nucleotidase family)